jgi:hypothetical protein
VPYTFLSDEWFAEVEKIRSDAADQVPPSIADVTLNVVVTGGPDGDRQMHLAHGAVQPGLVDGAPTKMTVPFEVAREAFVDGNQQAAMQAFMSGQIKVEGDMGKIMGIQAATASPTAEQQEVQKRIRAMTAS